MQPPDPQPHQESEGGGFLIVLIVLTSRDLPVKSLTKISHFFPLRDLHFVKILCHVVRHFVFRVLLLSDETLTCQTITSAWAAASRLLQLTVCPPSRWGRILSRSYLLFRILYCCCSQPLNRQAANLYRDMVYRFISEKRKKLNDWHSAAYYYISVCLEAAQYTIFNIRDIPQCSAKGGFHSDCCSL